MMKRLIFTLLITICKSTDICEHISELSICKHYLDYDEVSIPHGSCQDKLEYEIESLPMTLGLFKKHTCQEAVGIWVCSKYFKRCGEGSLLYPCKSLIHRIVEECSDGDLMVLSYVNTDWDVMKDLEGNITDNCNQPQDQEFSPTVDVPRCEKYAGGFCNEIVDYNLYVPSGFIQEDLEQRISDYRHVLSFVNSEKCLGTLLDFLCSMTFMPCELVFISELPQFPCHSLCLKAMDECASLFDSVPMLAQLKMNCSAHGTYIAPGEKKICGKIIKSAQPDFPLEKFVFKSVEEVGVEIASVCNPGASARLIEGKRIAPINAYSVVSCPYPLVKVPIGSGLFGGSCKDPCPSFVITSDEWDIAETIFGFFAPLSLVCSLFVFLTWIIFPKTRKHSAILYVASNILVVSIAEIVGIAFSQNGKIRNISCLDSTNIWGQTGSLNYCVIQGSIFFYCSNSAVAWWFLQALDLYDSVVHQIFKKNMYTQKIKGRCYILWGFVWPLIANIIMWGMGAFGGTGAAPWCFVKIEYDNWAWALMHYPILGQGCLVCYMIFRVLKSLWQSHLKTSNLRNKNSGSKCYESDKKLQLQIPTGKLGLTPSQKSSHGSSCEISSSSPRSSSNCSSAKSLARLPKKKSQIHGKDWEYFLRPILFVCVFWFLYVSFSIYAAIINIRMDDYIQSSTEFMTCIFSGGRAAVDSCGIVPSIRQPMVMWFYVVFVGSAQGFVMFLLYGTMPRNINLWKGLLSGQGLNGYKPERVSKSSHKSRSSNKVRPPRTPRSSNKVRSPRTPRSSNKSTAKFDDNNKHQKTGSLQVPPVLH